MNPPAPGVLLRGIRAGERRSLTHAPELRTDATFRLESPAFAADGPIPLRYAGTGVGDNISPAFAWSAPPAGTRSLVFLIEDVDVPLPRPLIHTIAILDGTRDSLAEDELAPGPTDDDRADVSLIPAGFGRRGYAGPRPLPGHGTHRYGFHLYAVDTPRSALAEAGSWRELRGLIAGHVLAAAHHFGTAERDATPPREKRASR
ncbi:YbhB/YbcL family Raf kinase inhibitor-like protein [Mycetocola tolaasinivorans]|uniref:YbhB/YbcL family Raf kinase inhibitor-like protein n=1 Tax=Mycetocola tolaasinivorans TaxID=76635 RepID=A0A3L7A4I8_9MICO|nr:YbhB/YbcL family Raf kinase inhibitor-like protein [Mycetocola tolaasinivorans]RLP74975.1 YbhB/YbcL family Raf kinase inhibitor-like protein [Mycetocola tolaasinivorans]